MWRRTRTRAKRLAEYTDQLVLRRRHEGGRPSRLDDAELEELGRLAAELTELDVAPPPQFETTLAAQIRRDHAADRRTEPWYQRMFDGASLLFERWTTTPARWRAAFAGAAVLLAVIIFYQLGHTPVVSAADVLMRSDEELAKIVQPGQVLYRKWHVRFTVWDTPAAPPVTEERTVEEWMDGADFNRVAGRSQTADGLVRAYASFREDGQVRSVAYRGYVGGNDPQAALNIEPTHQEYLQAADTFPPDASRLLHTYLRRHFIYMPIAGERRFNREILEGTAGGPMPRSVTVEDVVLENGKSVYAVRAIDPSRVQFLWQSGPPRVQVAREEAISYIAKDSYLTIKSQRTTEYRSGRRTFESRTLEDTRTYQISELSTNPFEIKVPEGTRINRQSAHELLSAILEALQKDAAARR